MDVNNIESTLVIMAGGKSSRMKRDKALLPFGAYNSLAEYQYKKYDSFFSHVYISSKVDKFDFNVDIIEDAYTDSSPLVALVSIFEKLEKVDEVFILSVDAPFVSQELIAKIYEEAHSSSDAIIACSTEGIEPLCGLYRRSILVKAKELLFENKHRLKGLLLELNTQEVFIEEHQNFMNLNYYFEYEEAMKLSAII